MSMFLEKSTDNCALVPEIGVQIAEEIDEEIRRAKRHGTTFASLHEAYAVILEELDEIWDVTRMKRRDRSEDHLYKEFVQLAAMAVKALHSMENFVGGTV